MKTSFWLERIVAIGLLTLVACALGFALNPGVMNADIIWMIEQAKSGNVNDFHSPLMVHLWRVFSTVGVDPIQGFFVTTIMFETGCYLLLRTRARPIFAASLSLLILLSPPVLTNMGQISRDAWMMSFVLMSSGCLAAAGRARTPRIRGLWVAVTIGFSLLALASRQNAFSILIVSLVPLILLLINHWEVRPLVGNVCHVTNHGSRGIKRRYIRRLAIAIALTTAVVASMVIVSTGITRVLPVQRMQVESVVMLEDLVSVSILENTDLIPKSVLIDPSLGFEPIRETHNNSGITSILWPITFVPLFISPDARAEIRIRWRKMLTRYPESYLKARAVLFAAQIGLTHPPEFVYQRYTSAYGIGPDFTRKNPEAYDHVDHWISTVTSAPPAYLEPIQRGRTILRPFIWLVVSVIGILILLRGRRFVADGPVIALTASAFSLQAALFFMTPNIAFRYEFPVIVTTTVMIAYLICRIPLGGKRR